MKWLLNLIDRARPAFGEGGRLRALKPFFEGVEFFLFSPGERVATAPYVRDPIDLKRYMAPAIFGVLPCAFAAVYCFGLRMLAMIIVSYAAGLLVEVIFAVVRKEDINEGFFVTGIMFPLILPPGLPLWAVAVGVMFGVIVGKELFGGTGRNLFNPALVGRCFLALSYAKTIAGSYLVPATGGWGNLGRYVTVATVDAVSSATPLSAAKAGTLAAPVDLLWGNVSGSAGETSAVAIIVGGLFLLLTRVGNWRTVAGVLGSFAALGALLNEVAPTAFAVPFGWHMLAGGLLFGAFFMATDPVTSPVTNAGKWVYGIIIGSVALLIRHLTGYVEGVMFAILLGNIVAPVLDEVVIRLRLRRLAYEG
ncbi:MAG: RnfABCDGE type electron transport complex subunit D [Planctomycetota bacterium]|jgi:Na(+)-translocating NADH:ubiquinone oxidoreductase B subunit